MKNTTLVRKVSLLDIPNICRFLWTMGEDFPDHNFLIIGSKSFTKTFLLLLRNIVLNELQKSLIRYSFEAFIALSSREEVVGIVYVGFRDRVATLHGIAVQYIYRNKGIGIELLNSMLLECRRRNVHMIRLYVRKSNSKAISLYQNVGFHVTKSSSCMLCMEMVLQKANRGKKDIGKEFFDSGKEEPGVYRSYRLEDWYPEFKILVTSIKRLFNPTKVLDIGCAKGFLVKVFEDFGVNAWGVDVSDYAISNSPIDIRSKLYKVDLDAEDLPFENGSFDFITILETLEYLNNHKQVIREVRRVLKDRGILYITTICKRDPRDKVRKNINNRTYWIEEFQSNEFRYMPERLNALLKEYLIQTFAIAKKNTVKFKLGKLIWQKSGSIGEQLIFLYRYLYVTYFSTIGILLFIACKRLRYHQDA